MANEKVEEGSVSRARLTDFPSSPRKVRLVVDAIRGKKVTQAIELLEFSPQKSAPVLRKLILSAVANAKERTGVELDELYIREAWVDEGKKLGRSLPRAQGRATPIKKRRSHITVVLDESYA